MRTTIILDPGEPEVQQVCDLVKVTSPGSWSHLFTNQAMQLVRHVALASLDGQPIGIGTLSYGDTFQDGYEVAGIWVHPNHCSQGIGYTILEYLVLFCQKEYQQDAYLFGLSPAGRALVKRAEKKHLPVIPVIGGGTIEKDFD